MPVVDGSDPVVDEGAEPGSERPGLETAGLPALIVLMTALAAGPLFFSDLPAGPGALLRPRESTVGVAGLLLLWLLLVWPNFQRDRRPAAVIRSGLLLLLGGLPIVVGAALAAGAGLGGAGSACLILLAYSVLTVAYLQGPGRSRRHDRLFVAGAAFVMFVIPLANYALNEFSGVPGGLGYRLSPILSLRRILMGLPGADPTPAILLGLSVGALLLAGGRALRVGGAAGILFVAAGLVGAEELSARPLLGDSYVPGRALPLLIEGAGGTGEVTVAMEGVGEFSAPARAGGTVIYVPGSEALRPVRIRSVDGDAEIVLSARPLRPARPLVVALGPVPADEVRFGESKGVAVSRALPAATSAEALAFLGADAVWDPAGLLPPAISEVISGAGVPVLLRLDQAGLDRLARARGALRRPWQEEGRILEGEDLFRLFRPGAGVDRGRSVRAFLLISGFAFLMLTGLRYCVRRGYGAAVSLGGVSALSAVTVLGLILLLPPLPGFGLDEFQAAEAGRRVKIVRITARLECEAEVVLTSPPLALGRGEVRVRRGEDGIFRLRTSLEARQSRIVITEGTGAAAAAAPGPVDLRFGPEGLSIPGGEPFSAGEFLKRYVSAPGWDATLRENSIRKLLRLADPPETEVGVRLPSPEDALLEVVGE